MSELALKLINENKISKEVTLDLGRCGLVQLPPETGELVWLESLSLSDEWAQWNFQGGLLCY